MPGFFAPHHAGGRLNLPIAGWRGVVGRVAAILATPLPQVMAMDWDEIVLWWAEADAIHADTWGLLPSIFLRR